MTGHLASRHGSGTALAGALATAMLGWTLYADQSAQTAGTQTSTIQQNAAAPTPDPWPDARTIESRRVSAEGRRLFQTDEPLAIKLTANFKTVNGDMDENSTKTYPATIEFADEDGTPHSIALQIRPRGHSRRKVCGNPPLRLEFPKDQAKGTVFDGHGALKLGTHCKPELDDYVQREYAAYRIYNLLTPRSFRARLARATYVDARNGKLIEVRNAMFIEDDDDVAKRLSGRVDDTEKLRFVHFDEATLALMTVFEYFIGNTDMSLYAQHNVNVVLTPKGVRYPVPYDFDYAGVVNAMYAVPGRGLGLVTVRTRLYRGPCLAPPMLTSVFDQLRGIRDRITAIYDGLPGLKPAYRKDVQEYLGKFYKTIDNPIEVKKAFVDGCESRPYM
ncbi:MAG TPA: hypothetical protein VFV78_06070 [Vicinamibacterales bacterium]|nr:hypothetical protein [Vicinamibacterales bacterium]